MSLAEPTPKLAASTLKGLLKPKPKPKHRKR